MVEDCDEPLREKGLDFEVRAAPVEVHLLAVPITLSDIFVRETVPLERLDGIRGRLLECVLLVVHSGVHGVYNGWGFCGPTRASPASARPKQDLPGP